MIQSMTGYAAGQGSGLGYRWSWELRSVNGRGLDLRLRVPDWIEGLEPSIRKVLSGAAARGNVSLSLRVNREDTTSVLRVNTSQLDQVLSAMAEIEQAAMDKGVTLKDASAADILSQRGVLDQGADSEDTAPLKAALEAELPGLIMAFSEMRQNEGAALRHILAQQLDEVDTLTKDAQSVLAKRQDDVAETLKKNLARVMDGVADMDEARVAQELALIAVKSDITEELDRLSAHVDAARALLDDGGAVGRKLDFLMQEFNREANTLCSKAQMKELTEKGLAMKVVVDQMREQVQNVE
jgi:uncharacterized protein (TIGR00255 family)